MKEFEFEILQITKQESDLLFRSCPKDTNEILLKDHDYKTTYHALLKSESEEQLLEDLHYIFNMDHPEDYRGRSLSVSDIVKINNDKCYYCNSLGWKEVKHS